MIKLFGVRVNVSIESAELGRVTFTFGKVLQCVNLIAGHIAAPVIYRQGLVVAVMKMVVLKVAYLAGKLIVLYNYYYGILYVKQFNAATLLAVVTQYALTAQPVRFRVYKLQGRWVGKFLFGSGFVLYAVFIGNLYYRRIVSLVEKLCLGQPVLHQ